jgi:hypothetical protein
MTGRPLHLLRRLSLANNRSIESPDATQDSGGGLVLGVALIGVLAVVMSVVISGPMTLLVQRQRANSAADASALALLWWGERSAHEIAQDNGAMILELDETQIWGGRRSTVLVQVGQVQARASASDAYGD